MTITTQPDHREKAIPPLRLSLGITGHRDRHSVFAANRDAIASALETLFKSLVDGAASSGRPLAVPRLQALLAHGADLLGAEVALEMGWDLVAPIPFGRTLNRAINAEPSTIDDAIRLLDGSALTDPELAKRAASLDATMDRARLFEMADADAVVTELFLETFQAQDIYHARQMFANVASDRVAAAGRVMIEQCDALIAIWDGVSQGFVGGTLHTMTTAATLGVPVIWIDANNPERWSLISSAEALLEIGSLGAPLDTADVARLARGWMRLDAPDQFALAQQFQAEKWPKKSRRRFHAYRRIESLFGEASWRLRLRSITQSYEEPSAAIAGSAAPMLANAAKLPDSDVAFVPKLNGIVHQFAWADGLSTFLSDAYRGGMVTNFILSAMAIVTGVAYLPLASVDSKWPFALGEFLLLATILLITAAGRKGRWHERWFETRRVAEYFRHAPIMLLLGASRTAARWPQTRGNDWPEQYCRAALREVGLPAVRIGQPYLRNLLENLMMPHIVQQRAYHAEKAVRLRHVHHRLDRLSEFLFGLAVLSVATYLVMVVATDAGWLAEARVHAVAKTFTFLGVILPALGGAFAGIRYFGDFERFAAISQVASEKLAVIETRAATMLAAPADRLHYARVAELAHHMDEVVLTELESWQAVFGGKPIAVPV